MQQSWDPATLSKKDSNTSIFLWIFRTLYGRLVYRTTPVAAFELSFSIRKEFKKKKSSGEIDCLCINWLVSCTNTRTCKQVNYHGRIYLSFIFEFCYHKIFKARSWWRLKRFRRWTWPLWPLCNWRYKDLSMPRDQMVMTLLPIMEKCPMDFYQEVVFVTRYTRICQSHVLWGNEATTSWGGVLNGTFWMRYIDFQTGHFPDFKQFGHFANLEHFTIHSHFSNFMHVKIDQSLLLWAGSGCFTEYGQDFRSHKTQNWFPQLINGL